jgi:ABC-type uncharacterized transport system permease subunit
MELRNFGYVMAGAFVALFGLGLPWLLDHPWPTWPWIVAAIFAGFGKFSPESLKIVFRIWMKFGSAMSKVMTPLVLGIVFYLVITPFGLVMRLFGRDPLTHHADPACNSYRVTSVDPKPENMERPF